MSSKLSSNLFTNQEDALPVPDPLQVGDVLPALSAPDLEALGGDRGPAAPRHEEQRDPAPPRAAEGPDVLQCGHPLERRRARQAAAHAQQHEPDAYSQGVRGR